SCGKWNHVGSAHGQAVVGKRTGCGLEALDCIQAVHRRVLRQLAPADEVARVADESGEMRSGKKIRVEREHYIGSFKFVDRFGILAEEGLRGCARRVAIDRIPLIPLRAGKLL